MRAGGILLVAIGLLVLAGICLFVWGQYWPKRFQARVPYSNMAEVKRAVGKPIRISTNTTIFTNTSGQVQWDYTRWWSGRARVYFDTNGNYVRTFTDF